MKFMRGVAEGGGLLWGVGVRLRSGSVGMGVDDSWSNEGAMVRICVWREWFGLRSRT